MRNEDLENFSSDPSPAESGTSTSAAAAESLFRPAVKPAVLDEVLIEEVSIDGMCGVY